MAHPNVGDTVSIQPDGYARMVGVVERVVKVPGPWKPETADASLWTWHVSVPGGHPRNSGTFCVGLTGLTGLTVVAEG